jgi:release factor glutamine methyltransferase
MYAPAEDSMLLNAAVEKQARGRFLDLGTGSGLLADTAHTKGLDVTAVDVDRGVVERLANKPYRVLHSNLFSSLQGERFDTIACNPPYLPEDFSGDAAAEPALYGGKKGYEYVLRMLEQAKHHLNPDGQILFLISTLTKPAVVEKALREQGYKWELVAEQPLFMEKLFVYRAQLAIGVPAVLVGRGKRSLVYRSGEFAVKVSTPQRASKEALLLRRANEAGVGPRFERVEGEQLWMEYVEGERFDTHVMRTRDKQAMRELLGQARALDLAGIRKHELHRPQKNVLVNSRGVVLLDFERSVFADNPGNVNQLSSWLSQVLGVDVSAVAARYKRGDESAYEELLVSLGL